MCFTGLLSGLFFTTSFSTFTHNPSNSVSNINLNSDVNVSINFNRIQREDGMVHTAVCSELHHVEDSPFIVMLLVRESGRLQCMGSIIDQLHVLTAKECVEKVDVPSLIVVAGYASPHFGKHSQVRFVNNVAKHPMMNLAILVLMKPFILTKTVSAIRMIGPNHMNQGFIGAYRKFKPVMVAGIVLPSKLSPLRGDIIPKGLAYQLKASKVHGQSECEKLMESGGSSKKLDENYNFCTEGNTQFCWTALGSPSVAIFENYIVQIGVVTFTKCRFIAPTPKPKSPPNPPINDYTPYEQTRLDLFWNWIKANSFIKDELRVKKRGGDSPGPD